MFWARFSCFFTNLHRFMSPWGFNFHQFWRLGEFFLQKVLSKNTPTMKTWKWGKPVPKRGSPWFNFGTLLEASGPQFSYIFWKKCFPKTHLQWKPIGVRFLYHFTDPRMVKIELPSTREHDFQKITCVAESSEKVPKVRQNDSPKATELKAKV